MSLKLFQQTYGCSQIFFRTELLFSEKFQGCFEKETHNIENMGIKRKALKKDNHMRRKISSIYYKNINVVRNVQHYV